MSSNCNICPEWDCQKLEDFKNVWVVGEVDENGITEASLQMLTPASKIASKLNTKIIGVLVGYNVKKFANQFIEYGADEVIVLDDEGLSMYSPHVYARAIAELAKDQKPAVIFISATMKGRELGPYVANTLRAGITADCTEFDVDEKTKDVLMIRPPFGAILLAYIKTPTRRPQVGTARPNVFKLPPRDPNRKGKIVEVKVKEIEKPKTRLISKKMLPISEVPIEKAELLVSGGKGLGAIEGFNMLKDLAKTLNAPVAGTRKAVDMGWIPHEKQVGQTGKSVKPILYIGVGLSGAAQHTFGIREAEVVLAINNDPNAPIFNQSDYGVVADFREVLPALMKELSELKNKLKAKGS
ncbi:MAG: electron transfer flavoprotein subunit alpha/FixB family protein [Caldisphaeraceae archaeon]|nr:electron transfer flavoprotein subunit alpha/FixB family protein [Caldisphaeraceae archaeon]